MIEGINYIKFKKIKIDESKAKDNINYWRKLLNFPSPFYPSNLKIKEQIKKVKGSHTFASKYGNGESINYPLLQIFGYDNLSGTFDQTNAALLSDSIRKGDGRHMGTARQIGLDKFVFSYLGMHLPYHRINDVPPVCPFGLFINVANFPYSHGSPCDRDFKTNNLVDKENLDKYYLLPEDLEKIILHRIIEDPLFKADFMRYYGTVEAWGESDYRTESWKKKGEYCFYELIDPSNISAILWPMWEEEADMENKTFKPDELQQFTSIFKQNFNINIIIYRPYRNLITKENWENNNLRDWELALIEASSISFEYFEKFEEFPPSIDFAKSYL